MTMTTKKDSLFHLESLEPSNRTLKFIADHELLSSDDFGYDSYVANHEPNKNPQVVYKLNKQGFRSENFEPLNSKNLNILISGCSVTFGQGVFQEHSWPELFSKTLSQSSSKPIKMHNLGIMGASIYLIVKNLMAFIRRYGAPDQIYLFLPPYSRKLVYDEAGDNFHNIVMSKQGYHKLAHKKDLSEKRFYDSYCEEDSLLFAITLMGIFENFCEARNIDLVWTSYATLADFDIYSKVGFKFYRQYDAPDSEFYNNYKTLMHLIPENKYNIPHWNEGADVDHPGAAWHQDISRLFLDFRNRYLHDKQD
jgi:hypothetical protein